MSSTLLTAADSVYSLDALRDAGREYTDPAALNELAQMENRVAVAQLVQVLDEKQFQVIDLIYGEGVSTHSAAKTLGLSQSDVSRTERAALARMRKFLEVS